MKKQTCDTTYSSVDIALKIADICKKHGIEINNTKINKLLYIIYGIYLAKYNKRLVDEQPKLWPYGPVFPNVFQYMKKNKTYKKNIEINKDTLSLLDHVVSSFGNFSAGALTKWSHQEGSPWQQLVDISCKWNEPILDSVIKDYFLENVISNK